MNNFFKKSLLVTTLCAFFVVQAQETFILNYEDVDIKKVTQDIANFSKKTIILDPRVKGKVTIFSNSSLSSDEVWDVYLRTIQVNGFSALNDENFVRIVPENEATRDQNSGESGGEFITRVIELKNRSSVELLPLIKPIAGRQANVSSIASINSLLVVDRKSNVERITEVVQSLDEDNTASVTIVDLKNLSSVEAVRILEKLKSQNNPTINNFVAISFSASNSVIVSANSITTNIIKETLQQLDDDAISEGSVAVIYLKYANAEEVAGIVSSIASRFISSESEKPIVTYHAPTNSVVVSSDESNIATIKNLISKLDIRRAQVLVEAIVVELSETAARSLGVETIFAGAEDGEIPIGITRFQNGTGPDLLGLTGSAIESGDNANFSNIAANSLLNSQGIIAGIGRISEDDDSMIAIINAIDADKNSNILTTTSLLAMDNEEASTVIGQEIPITTGESLGSNNTNPFRTTSREEVGIKLSVKPQINEGNSVILEIKQEVSGVAGPLTGTTDLITNKRTIETTVLVDNNQIIVLGGLVDEDIQEDIQRVPVLGSIPVLGKLFQSSSESKVKKNLMVFLRPKILVDSESVSQISTEKYNFIKAEQLLKQQSKLIDLTEDK
ncbi:MAG: type II secretion system protein GspD [Gammaproteobacteria bacterium]|nr:MAG: type II secretion system protein GspD [Gammaproteobacteria bacterium]